MRSVASLRSIVLSVLSVLYNLRLIVLLVLSALCSLRLVVFLGLSVNRNNEFFILS